MSLSEERLNKQISFITEIDRMKRVMRQTPLADGSRKENDAEHSWHTALMALLLKEYAPDGADAARASAMLLVHDLVEIDAGDTYAYDEAAASTQKERETKAANRVFSMLPDDQRDYFRSLWEEFDEYETPDAKYAHMLDNFQPLLLNDASHGISWKEHEVSKAQIYKRNEKLPETSDFIWMKMKEIIDKNINAGNIRP